MSKFRRAIEALIADQLSPFMNLAGPEQLTMTSTITNGGVGEAVSKIHGRVFVSSDISIKTGATVVAVPIGSKRYHVVGTNSGVA